MTHQKSSPADSVGSMFDRIGMWLSGARERAAARYPVAYHVQERLGIALRFFLRPARAAGKYRLSYLQADLISGLTIAMVALPQVMAYALIAELPPQVGLYTAIVGAIVGSLWGSSHHLQTGPTNAISLLTLSILLGVASPSTPEYMLAAGVMAVLVGVFQLTMGLARLGVLVDFVSDSVVVGFTTGAGLLIFCNQIRNLLRLDIRTAPHLWETVPAIIGALPQTHWLSLAVSMGTIVLILILRRLNRRLPAPFVAMLVASLAVGLFHLDVEGVQVIGELPTGLPPLAGVHHL